jgi:hypothetical protein
MEYWFTKCQKLKQLEKWRNKLETTEIARGLVGPTHDLEEILYLVYQSRLIPAHDIGTELKPGTLRKESSKNSISLMESNLFYVLADSDSE